MSVSLPPLTGRRKAAMSFIMVTVLLDMMAIGLIIPVMPHIVGTFTDSKEAQAWWFGAVALSFGVANFFGAPVLGALSDRFGRRPVLLIGIAGLALSFIVTGLATALWMLILVRLFTGAMHANAAVANAYVADITPAEDRARRFGLLGAMFGIGFILGPVMGGILGDIDVRLPFFAAGGLALLNWLWGYFVLPESLPPAQRRDIDWRRVNPLSSLSGLARLSGVGPLVAVIALASLAQFMLHTSWVLYTNFKFGWGPAQVGWSLFAVGSMMALVQGVLLKHLLRRFSAQRLAAVGLVAGALTYLGYGLATEGWMIYVVIFFGTLVAGSATAAIQSLISNAADAKTQGQTMGSVASLNSLMAVSAPILATPLLGVISRLPQQHWLMGLPFYVCALLQLLSAILAIRFFRRRAHAVPAHA